MTLSVEFLPNPARKPEGLGEGGIEQFRGKPYVSCARETGQNSNDAGAKEDGKPVIMKFNLHQISRSDLPFADELLEACQICLDESEDKAKRMKNDPDTDRTVQFFRRAVKEAAADEISVLEIADFNTTGLTGPMDDAESVFNSLVKADGVNNKRNDDSGGAFGIGKKAAFATSNVQTVLYSTLTETEDGDEQRGIQARLQLLSHERNGEPFRAEGYWGNPNFAPIIDVQGLPDWMVREERGTSLFVICFPAEEHWARNMEISILTNFTTAIFRGRMEFEIDDGKIKINKATLSQRLASEELDEIAKGAGLSENLAYARYVLRCLSSGATETFQCNVPGYGKADLHILVEQGLPRRILIVRNGMFITDHLRAFDQPLTHFSQTMEFLAVLEPSQDKDGKKFGALLKRLENPEHNAFEPSRIISAEEQGRVKQAIQKLVKEVRDQIKETAKVATSDSDDIQELAHLFAAEAGEEPKEGSEADPERFSYGQAQKRRNRTKTAPPGIEPGNQGGSGTTGRTSETSEGGGSGKGTGSGVGGKGTKAPRRRISLISTRICDAPASQPLAHEIHFTPDESGRAEITIAASGLTTASELPVAKVSVGAVDNGKIQLDLEKGKRLSISFDLSEAYHGPMEISAIALSEEAPAS